VPMLWRYRQAVGRAGETRLGRLAALVGVAYFFVWTVFGMAAFPLGVALAAVEMQLPALARAVPIAGGDARLSVCSIPLSAILLSAALFFSVMTPDATKPNGLIYLAYVGAVILAAGLLILGIGLIRKPRQAE
jgi:hypothetical protein